MNFRQPVLFRLLKLVHVYYIWLGFAVLILVMITAFASNDLIRAYSFHWQDVGFTFAFLTAWALLDALLVSLGLAALEILLERIFRKNLALVFKGIAALCFITAWLSVLRLIFLNRIEVNHARQVPFLSQIV